GAGCQLRHSRRRPLQRVALPAKDPDRRGPSGPGTGRGPARAAGRAGLAERGCRKPAAGRGAAPQRVVAGGRLWGRRSPPAPWRVVVGAGRALVVLPDQYPRGPGPAAATPRTAAVQQPADGRDGLDAIADPRRAGGPPTREPRRVAQE